MGEQAESAENAEMDLEARVAESPDSDAAVMEEALEEKAEAPSKSHHSKSTKIKDFRDTENPKGFPVNFHAENGEERRYDTTNGSVAIIWYRDEKTGEVYFSLERKSKTHPSKGKYAFYGGTVMVGEPHNEALVRELSEEDPKGYKIVLNALKDNGYKLTELVERVDGRTSRTSVYVAEIKGDDNWKKYISTKTLAEGDKVILSFEEVGAAINEHSFAYPQQGEALGMFIKTDLEGICDRSHSQYMTSSRYQAYTTTPFKTSVAPLEIYHNPKPVKAALIVGHIGPKYNVYNQEMKKAA